MNSVSSKTITICEKQTAPDLLNNTSQCSCDKCDSYRCFALRNRTPCSCEKCPKSFDDTLTESKVSSKTSKIGVCTVGSFMKERVKKEITYDDSNNNLERSSMELSRTATKPRKDYDSDTAKLSAQVMNVPYSDFKQSVSYNKTDIAHRTTKMTKLDIFRRIKDAYKACSCKVCECIIGKSNTCNEFCKCKPCQCKDCVAVMNNLKLRDICQRSGTGYASTRCDSKICKGLVKKSFSEAQYCDCDPCDCLKCFNTFNEPCNCKPCECIECKAYSIAKPNTLIVGRVREDVPRNYCSCSPCECAECVGNYPMTSSVRHEMSTGISRPNNCYCETCLSQTCEASDSERCSCEIQKQIIQKPFQKDTRDYDIHRASINKSNVIDKPNINTIAMFAAVENISTKPNLLTAECECVDCECLACNQKNKFDAVIKSSRIFNTFLLDDSCNCLPCECEVCKEGNIRSTIRIPKPCTCDVCDCLKCEGFTNMTLKRNKDNYIQAIKRPSTIPCKCRPCECADCQRFIDKSSINNYCHTYSESTVSCHQDNLIYGDQSFLESKVKGRLNDVKRYSKHISNKEKPIDSHCSSSTNIEKTDVCGRIKYIKNPNSHSSKPVQELDKASLMCDIYKQCTEKCIPHLDRSSMYNSSGSENFISKHYSYECAVNTTKQNNNINPQFQKDIVSSYTSRYTLRDTTDKDKNNKSELNSDIELNSTKKSIDYDWNHTKDIKNDNLDQGNTDNISDSNLTYFESNIQNMEKFNTPIVKTKQKQICNVKEMSENLVHSLKDANRKFSNVKYKNFNNEVKASNLKDTVINETVDNDNYKPDKIDGIASDNKIDFEKVKHSLQQAKAFSIELIKLLKQYEKANYDYHKLSNLEYLKNSKNNLVFTRKGKKEKRHSTDDSSLRTEAQNNLRLNINANSIFEKYKTNKEEKILRSNNDDILPTTSNKLDLIDYLLSERDTNDFRLVYNQCNTAGQEDKIKLPCCNNDSMRKEHLN